MQRRAASLAAAGGPARPRATILSDNCRCTSPPHTGCGPLTAGCTMNKYSRYSTRILPPEQNAVAVVTRRRPTNPPGVDARRLALVLSSARRERYRRDRCPDRRWFGCSGDDADDRREHETENHAGIN